MNTGAQLFVALQRILPLHSISAGMHALARAESWPVRRALIGIFRSLYAVNLGEAERTRADEYRSFNDVFTRALKPGARPVDPDPRALLSPCDGRVSEIGALDGDRLLQAAVTAKRHTYTLEALLADAGFARDFVGGSFACLYLAPVDYHRVHLPVAGRLVAAWYVPGHLYSVNAATAALIPGLFALNERLVLHFATTHGPLALVLVGALNVGSMSLADLGDVTPSRGRGGPVQRLAVTPRDYARGEEVGRFNLGSTVVLVLPPAMVQFERVLHAGSPVRLGQRLGTLA